MRSGIEGSQVGVQHSCKNSPSHWPPPALWHKEAMEWLQEVGAKEELLFNGERVKQNFLLYDLITSQVFLPFFEVRWNWNHVGVK